MPSGKQDKTKKVAQRGRPPVTGSALAARQGSVLKAAGDLLAGLSSSDITVEQLTQAAGTSRPTFYRWFPGGIEQVVEMLIMQANQDLMTRIIAVTSSGAAAPQLIEEGIRAYFDWGSEIGPVVYGIYREGFDEKSPAWRYRQQTIGAVTRIIRQQSSVLGFDHVSDLYIETLVGWIESAGATLFRHYPVAPGALEEQRELTTRMLLAMLEVVR